MIRKHIINYLKKQKLISLATMAFIAVGALLVSLALTLAVNLSGSINTLMAKAITPDFLQMHQGELDLERLQRFVSEEKNISDFQVLEFLNIEGEQIEINGESVAHAIQDFGLSVQSEHFDFLLDLDNEILQAAPGEIYLPLMFLKEQTVSKGDTVIIAGHHFTVDGFLRDSQMNASMSGSKRFLVHPSDFAMLLPAGLVEYLIEFRLHDRSLMTEFENAYQAAGLEANGSAVTYSQFSVINAISDGIVIAVLLLATILIVLISFLSIRFTLLAAVEDDYREIGVMRAIGLKPQTIKRLYLGRFLLIAGAGVLIGFLVSLFLESFLLENIYLFMGKSNASTISLPVQIGGVLLLLGIILLYVNHVLKRIRRVSPVQAIRQGVSAEASHAKKSLSLRGKAILPLSTRLALADIHSRKKQYVTILLVLILATFLIVIPQNLYYTLSDRDFIKTMGLGEIDLRIDIGQTERPLESALELEEALKGDPDVAAVSVFQTRVLTGVLEDGRRATIKADIGDHAIFPIEYKEGRAPADQSEIALSLLYADDLDLTVGDSFNLSFGEKLQSVTVSGIYSDISSGGKTAKYHQFPEDSDLLRAGLNVRLTDAALADAKMQDYLTRFPGVKISSIPVYIEQVFGGLLGQLQIAAIVAAMASLIVTALIALLFMRLMLAKDRQHIAVLRGQGFSLSSIRKQFIARYGFMLVLGLPLGLLLAGTLGSRVAGFLVSAFGATSVRLSINPLITYVLTPLAILVAVFFAGRTALNNIDQYSITNHLKEST